MPGGKNGTVLKPKKAGWLSSVSLAVTISVKITIIVNGAGYVWKIFL
jgi:hypothetical protein